RPKRPSYASSKQSSLVNAHCRVASLDFGEHDTGTVAARFIERDVLDVGTAIEGNTGDDFRHSRLPRLERDTPVVVIDLAVDFEQISDWPKIARQQGKQYAVDHSHCGLLFCVKPHRHSVSLELDNFIPRKPEGIGKRPHSAPQHSFFGDQAESAV